jgi:hypothetical protein
MRLQLFISKQAMCFLSGKLKDWTKIYYFSDGAASEYKNSKNFINLCYHKDDFGMDVKQHIFTMSCGKGARDEIRKTIIRMIRNESL